MDQAAKAPITLSILRDTFNLKHLQSKPRPEELDVTANSLNVMLFAIPSMVLCFSKR